MFRQQKLSLSCREFCSPNSGKEAETLTAKCLPKDGSSELCQAKGRPRRLVINRCAATLIGARSDIFPNDSVFGDVVKHNRFWHITSAVSNVKNVSAQFSVSAESYRR